MASVTGAGLVRPSHRAVSGHRCGCFGAITVAELAAELAVLRDAPEGATLVTRVPDSARTAQRAHARRGNARVPRVHSRRANTRSRLHASGRNSALKYALSSHAFFAARVAARADAHATARLTLAQRPGHS
eukprot:IDg15563t1